MENMTVAQLIEMIEFYEVSLDPRAEEWIQLAEITILSIEERENAGIA
jgi:hypothetical protein